MDITKLSWMHQAFMRDFLLTNYANSGIETFNSRISDQDEMFYAAVVPGYADIGDAYLAYMQSGRRMLDVLDQLGRHAFGGLDNAKTALEFACGYGRFTRHLVMGYSDTRLFGSDIYRGAIDWQHRQFGVTGVYSVEDPSDFSLVSSFDVIFVGSLFSHLPEDLFRRWLERLYSMLSPNGFIAFSVHDVHLLGRTTESEEFQYCKHSESDSLSHEIYGMTYVSEGHVRKVINDVCGASPHRYRRFFKGLYENQDLYVVSKSDDGRWTNFQLQPTPIGGRTSSRIDDGKFIANAWGLDFGEECALGEVELIVNGASIDRISTQRDSSEEISKFFPGAPNEAVRFRIEIPTSDFPPDSVVKARLSRHPDYAFDVFLGCITS